MTRLLLLVSTIPPSLPMPPVVGASTERAPLRSEFSSQFLSQRLPIVDSFSGRR